MINDSKIVLVGNKADAQDQRKVLTTEGSKLAAELGVTFFETSAKTGASVNDMFQKVASLLPGMARAEKPKGGACVHATGGEKDVATPEVKDETKQQLSKAVAASDGGTVRKKGVEQVKKKGCCGC